MAETFDQGIGEELTPIYDGPVAQITVRIPGTWGDVTDLLVPVVKDGQLAFSEVGGHVFLRTVSGDLIAVRHIVRISGLDAAVRECEAAAKVSDMVRNDGTENQG